MVVMASVSRKLRCIMANKWVKKCPICEKRIYDDVYCEKCWKIALAIVAGRPVHGVRAILVEDYLDK